MSPNEQFDTIVSKVELVEEHQLSCFLGGLKQDVQMLVMMFQPDSIRKAFSLAKMYESAITANPQQKLFYKSAKTSHFSKPPLLPTPPNPAETSKPKIETTRNLTATYMSERRAKGLCYLCDELFTP